MSLTYRDTDRAVRAVAIVGVLALALSLLPLFSSATAQAQEARGIGNACGGIDLGDDDLDFPDIGGFSEDVQDAVRCQAAYEITIGYTDGTYRPGLNIPRYQMALFLSRIIDYAGATTGPEPPAPTTDPFDDIGGLSDEAQVAINTLHELEITTGTTETTFSPHAPVTRRDMSSFLVRLQNWLDDDPAVDVESDVFPDVPDSLARADDVNTLAAKGAVQGFADGNFRPFAPVIRGHMALFVMRFLDFEIEAGNLPALASLVDALRVTPTESGNAVGTTHDFEVHAVNAWGDPVGQAGVDAVFGAEYHVYFEVYREDNDSWDLVHSEADLGVAPGARHAGFGDDGIAEFAYDGPDEPAEDIIVACLYNHELPVDERPYENPEEPACIVGDTLEVDDGSPTNLAATLPAYANKSWAAQTVTLLHDTHLHGTFGDDEGASIARYMALAGDRKDVRGDALFIGNGDDIAPSLLSGVFRGEHMIEVLNASPLDVNTLGNHEFDYGPDQLRELIEDSDFPWVSANVRDIASGEPFAADLGVELFTTFDVGGVDVAVTGLGPVGMETITSLGDETEQIDPLVAMEEVVPQMQAAADLVVVASHLGGDDALEVAAEVDGIDAIVGDHHAEVLERPEVINNTIVSFVGDEFDFLGEINIHLDDDADVVGHSFTLHEITTAIEPDPAIQTIVDDYNAQLDEELNVVIGERTVTWDTRRPIVRNEEAAIGNFIADSMREFHDADIAVQNSGGIRADTTFEPGDITRREVAEILPFDNYVVKAEIDGWVIEEMLEHSVSDFPDSDGRFLQVSGIEMTFDATNPVGERVTEATLNGDAIDPDATYTIATNDFTLGGGDAYDMLADEATVIVGAEGGPLLSAFIIETIEDMTEAGQTVDTDVEGRITRLDN